MADTNAGTMTVKIQTAIEAFVKSGLKTTEFWSLILGVATIVLSSAVGIMQEQPWAPIAIAAMFIMYTIARVWMKLEAMKKVNIIPDEWESKINEILDVVKNVIELEKTKTTPTTTENES